MGVGFDAFAHYHRRHSTQRPVVLIQWRHALELLHAGQVLIDILLCQLAFALYRHQGAVVDHEEVDLNPLASTPG